MKTKPQTVARIRQPAKRPQRWPIRGLAAWSCAAWTVLGAAPASAQPAAPQLSADARADQIEARMTLDEKLVLVRGYFGATLKEAPAPLNAPPPAEALGSAGYVPGIARLDVPALQESDASLGVANGADMRPGDEATPLPSTLATASSWNPKIAYDGGAMIGDEAWRKGFNVLLAGGVDLARDPRNGRNFEYAGEDPLLAGVLVGESIRGIQDQHVISTAKHFAVNDQETGRMVLNAVLDEKAMRESDLLAFEIAIERGRPGAVMCAYNRINGDHGCENGFLLNTVLKRDWAYKGWVLSDWGGVHSTAKAVLNGLDQESAHTFDRQDYFGAPLKQALATGQAPQARLDDMVHRILRSMIAVGLLDHPPVKGEIDQAAHAAVAQRAEEEGIVLLKNDGALLPLAATAKSIAVIGAHADVGVLSGGGSSQVIAYGGTPLQIPLTEGPAASFARITYHPSSPLRAIRAAAPGAKVQFAQGDDVAAAVAAARAADVVVVFAQQWQTEAQDAGMALPDGQDALIEAIAAANPRTVVVLETGNPVSMPWLPKVGAVLEAWYPGARGGDAIANVLFGAVNPSGKLPISFPKDETQLPRPAIPGAGRAYSMLGSDDAGFDVAYAEGAAVGYKWFESRGLKPLFAFGHGLSYTRFGYGKLALTGGRRLTVQFTVTNTGGREGAEVAQVYAQPPGAGAQRRLVGWSKVVLRPGESRRVTVMADPRLLAAFDTEAHGWRLGRGAYAVTVGASSADVRLRGSATMEAQSLKP